MIGIKFVDHGRKKNPDLSGNCNLPYGRLKSVVKRLRENPEMLKMYVNVIKDQLNKGLIDSVDDNSNTREVKTLSSTPCCSYT